MNFRKSMKQIREDRIRNEKRESIKRMSRHQYNSKKIIYCKRCPIGTCICYKFEDTYNAIVLETDVEDEIILSKYGVGIIMEPQKHTQDEINKLFQQYFTKYSKYLFYHKQSPYDFKNSIHIINSDTHEQIYKFIDTDIIDISFKRIFHKYNFIRKIHSNIVDIDKYNFIIKNHSNSDGRLEFGTINYDSIDPNSIVMYFLDRRKYSMTSLLNQIVYKLENQFFDRNIYKKCQWYLKHIQFENKYYNYNI